MKNIKKYLAGLFVLVLIAGSCQKVPLTGRNQFVGLVSSDQMMGMSYTQYTQFLDTSNVLPLSDARAQMIARVGERIKTAAEDYLIENNLGYMLNGYQWEFKTVDSKEINAWCMPGGKVCFYTGILPVCETEAGVAVVMGHEVAHAIAEHGRERMSNTLVAQGFTQVGAVAAGIATGSQEIMELAGQVLGVGAMVGHVLPNSRKHETEADKIGLIFMAMAGYDPHEAVEFWKRMKKAGEGYEKPPMLLSTHPADDVRIADMEKMLPLAMKYYDAYAARRN